ncbi:inner membrane protein YhjD [Mycobacterium sp. SMC-4]|uniref:inner membrane protein YhjD n=1 Tax=Mycobacterium sp. SMC-4 TaxID=2857059 RepID=UPI003D08B6D0
MTASQDPSDSDEKPGFIDRFRARRPWFDHVMRAQERYKDSKGDFYAAGITYFTIFALFPLLMVGFAVGGFVLASQPELLAGVQDRIRSAVSGDMGQQLIELMDSAIESRASVGLIGLATAAWAGLGWMANLREALSQMWGLYRDELPGFVRTKISDLVALLSVFVAIVLTLSLTALGNMSVIRNVLEWFGITDAPVWTVVLRIASTLVSVLVAWLLFTFLIARLPRESVSFRSSVRAGLIAAVGFEIFKLVAAIYLQSVVTGPAGATFGPVLGLMVFAYITARLVLFATAWAATMPENMNEAPVAAPGPAVIRNRPVTRPGLAPWQAGAAALVGAVGALGFSRARRSRSLSRGEDAG